MAYREINRLNSEIDKANRAYGELVSTYQNYMTHARADSFSAFLHVCAKKNRGVNVR